MSTSTKNLALILGFILVLLFGYFVWPTTYAYYTAPEVEYTGRVKPEDNSSLLPDLPGMSSSRPATLQMTTNHFRRNRFTSEVEILDPTVGMWLPYTQASR